MLNSLVGRLEAPANVVSVARKMGASTEMVTQLGNDAFGDIIVETLKILV